MSRTIVGRERELAVLSEFLEGIADRPPALAIEGDAGAGKTTLWLEGLRLADTVGVRVLRAQPAGAEAKLSFAAFGDLLRDVADGAGSLPAPQGKALRAALLLEESAAAAPDAHAVALATLAVLRQTGASGPTLLAIDDVQWLDAPSAQALAFALRRLDAVPIGVLTARRLEPGASDPLALQLSFPELRRLVVGPLPLDDIDRLLRERLGTRFLRPALRRLHQASGGNPFFALELARALAGREAQVEPGAPLGDVSVRSPAPARRVAGGPAADLLAGERS